MSPISQDLLDVLACQVCKGLLELVKDGTALDCRTCLLRYPIEEDGSPNMIVEAAARITAAGELVWTPPPAPPRRKQGGRRAGGT
jgi:uncharacterized protein YbaR (Trm112 family)